MPQDVENKHKRIESGDVLEGMRVLRNQQVAGSIPAGGSIKSITSEESAEEFGFN